MGLKFGAQYGNKLGSQLGSMSITKLSPNWACQMGPIHCPKFLLPGHPLQSPVPNLKFPAAFPTRTFANSSPFSQPALLDHHPVSPFLGPRSLLISSSSTEP